MPDNRVPFIPAEVAAASKGKCVGGWSFSIGGGSFGIGVGGTVTTGLLHPVTEKRLKRAFVAGAPIEEITAIIESGTAVSEGGIDLNYIKSQPSSSSFMDASTAANTLFGIKQDDPDGGPA